VRVELAAEEASLVSSRLEAVRPALQRRFAEGTLAWEGPQFLLYRTGDFFVPHRDRPVEPEDAVSRRRRVSIVIFLNGTGGATLPETYDGGALTFYGLLDGPRLRTIGYPLRAEAGLLIAFRSDILHEVTPVSRAERYSIVAWLAET
jgi:SM-20-related protein